MKLLYNFVIPFNSLIFIYLTFICQAKSLASDVCSSADPNENAMAERLYRTLKEEFNLGNGFVLLVEIALKAIPEVIETYNYYLPHASLDYKTPTQCHDSGRVEKIKVVSL
jgi:putative transposase